jgi:hypothetical protein
MSDKLRKATHAGTINIGNVEIPCFVLEDGTRVISGRGMTSAIGMKGRGQGVARIASHKTITPFLSDELKVAIETPLLFIGVGSRHSKPTAGFEATILHGLCEAILTARDEQKLKTEQEQRYAKFCEILVRSLAKVGIIALVDEATGYQEIRDKKALQEILDKYLMKEFAVWAKRFPDEFYKQMFRLRGWQWRGMRVNRPSVVGKYTNDLIYQRLAPGVLDELQKRNPKDEKGNREGKHHQLLTPDLGIPALQNHLFATTKFMEASATWDQFYRSMQRAFPKLNSNLVLNFPEPDDNTT